jgi:hypothetical protein
MMQNEATTVPLVTRTPPRPWRKLMVCVLVFALALFAVGSYLTWSAERDFQEALAETDRIDPGWRLDDIEAARAVLPDEENAAIVVLQIHDAIGGSAYLGERLEQGIGNTPQNTPFDAEQAEVLEQYLAKHAKGRSLVELLKNLTTGRYPSRYDTSTGNVNFDYLQRMRGVMRFVQFDIMLAAQQNDGDRAIALCRAGINTARSVGDEPNLIGHLVSCACLAISVGALERSLAMTTPAPVELQKLQTLLDREIAEQRLWVAIRGERALGMKLREVQDPGKSLAVGKGWHGWAAEWLPVTVSRDRATYLRAMNEVVETSTLPVEQQFDAMTEKVDRWQGRDAVLSASLPGFSKVTSAHVRVQAQLRSAMVALAVERYRHEHDHWPVSLDALVASGHLKAVPLDPFDGRPLRYTRLANGILVYSVGYDRVDDGGVLGNNPMAPGTDIGFRLWDVAARRTTQK